MDISFSQVFKGIGFTLFTGLFIMKYRQIKEKKQKKDELKQQSLKDLSYLQQMKQGQSVYIKAKLKNEESNKNIVRKESIPISYNQYYLEEPSELLIIKNIYHEQEYFPIFYKKIFNFVDSLGKQKKFVGINKIIGDPFLIRRQYEPQELGFLKRFWGGFCYIIQNLFDIIRKAKFHDQSLSNVPQTRTPFIMGPMVGVLHYTISLITDTFFVLKINFDNGSYKVEILAQSTGSLLSFYEHDLNTTRFQTVVFGLLATIFGYFIYRDVKKTALYQKIKKKAQQGQKQWLFVENVSQDKCCVICYCNCRNLILFNCKHVIVCWDCLQNLKDQHCPICKKQIVSAKVIQAIEKE